MPTNKQFTIPLVYKNQSIKNYTQIIAELKETQKRYTLKTMPWRFLMTGKEPTNLDTQIKAAGNIFVEPRKAVDNDYVLSGFAQQKVKQTAKKFEAETLKKFIKKVDAKIEVLKRRRFMRKTIENTLNENDIFYIENNLEKFGGDDKFKNEMLGDIFEFLKAPVQQTYLGEKIFLQNNFLKFIKKFFSANSAQSGAAHEVEDRIGDFCKMKYNRFDYSIEVFEDKYIYAELYVLIRCGLYEKARKMLKSPFFSHEFAEGVKSLIEMPHQVYAVPTKCTGDHFKIALLNLIAGHEAVLENSVVETLEDALWLKVNLHEKGIKIKFDDISVSDENASFLLAIMTKDYEKAIEILLGGYFDTKDVFYLGAEIFKRKKTENFIDFVYSLASKFTDAKNKAKIVEMFYFERTNEKIVEFDLLNAVSFLSPSCVDSIIKILKDGGNKKKLLKLYFIRNDVTEISTLMEEALSDEIISGKKLKKFEDFEFYEAYSYLTENGLIEKNGRIEILKGFLDLKIKRNEFTLQRTALFDETLWNTISSFYCIDCVFCIASEVVFISRNGYLARKLVELIGRLGIGGNTQQAVLKQLLVLL